MAKETKKPKKTTAKKTDTKKIDEKPVIIPDTVVKITIPQDEADLAYNIALNRMAKSVKVAGFRKGKVPPKVAEEHLNRESIVEEALRDIVPSLYSQQIEKDKVKPLTYPEFRIVSIKKGGDWVVEAHVGERPTINLKGYKPVVKKALKEAEQEIRSQEKARKKHEKECEDKKHPHKEPTKRELDNMRLNFIYKALVTHVHPQIQEKLVKEEAENDIKNLMNQLKQYNITFEKYLESRKMTADDFTNEFAANALTRIQISFIVDQVAEEEKITVTQKELDAEIDQIQDEKLKEQRRKDQRYLEMMEQALMRDKVADFLVSLK